MSDPSLITMAAELARKAHWDQRDKAGVPFITHPARVADSVSGRCVECRAAAWLHDVVEDTDWTLEALGVLFPARVVELVNYMTRRRGEQYKTYILRIAKSGDVDAIALKLADLADNSNVARLAGINDPELRARMAKMVDGRYAWARSVLVEARSAL